ncbi:MAG: Y-family DNA polymerase [Rubricella sp.]
MTGRRIVSIWLPNLPLEQWMRIAGAQGSPPDPERPLALAVEAHHGPIVHAANSAARRRGVAQGARVTDMRALCPDLQVEYADSAGDRALRERLALWARRWCPWSVAEEDGLVLDTTGCAHLFGGEAALLYDIEARFAGLGLTARSAVAPSRGSAWALARFGPVRAVQARDGLAAALSALPVQALRLDPGCVQMLHRLGLKTVADIAAIPRLSLTRRFGRAAIEGNPLLRLDQAMGRLAEPVSGEDAPEPVRSVARLPEPIEDPASHLPALCEDLCERLARQDQGARRLRLRVFRTDGQVSAIAVATSRPGRDPAHLLRLLGDRLERIDPGFGFDLIELEALDLEPLGAAQPGLDTAPDEALDIARLVDRLTARFGRDAVTRPTLRESHIPERALLEQGALASPGGQAAAVLRERPVRLLRRPEEIGVTYAAPEGPPARFTWRRQVLNVTRYAGPERIAPEWWRDKPGTRLRDYFRVEDQAGRRYWIYREGLHGDGRGGDPRWFLHGMFA